MSNFFWYSDSPWWELSIPLFGTKNGQFSTKTHKKRPFFGPFWTIFCHFFLKKKSPLLHLSRHRKRRDGVETEVYGSFWPFFVSTSKKWAVFDSSRSKMVRFLRRIGGWIALTKGYPMWGDIFDRSKNRPVKKFRRKTTRQKNFRKFFYPPFLF